MKETEENNESASGLKRTLHGISYQWQLIIFFLERGLDLKYEFELETENPEAGKFDDIVFSYKPNEEKKIKYCFLQVKHKQNEDDAYITASDLKSKSQKNPFSLHKYFISYKEFKEEKYFKNERTNIIIFTNYKFAVKDLNRNKIYLKPVDNKDIDPLLKMPSSNKKKTQNHFHLEVKDVPDLYEELKENSDAHLLAKKLAEYVCGSKKLTLRSPILNKYHVALASEVIDVETRKFKDDFFKSKESRILNFRNKLVEEILSQENEENLESEEEVIKYLERKVLSMTNGFKEKRDEKQPLPSDLISNDDIKEFFNKLVFAVDQPNEIELRDIIKEDLRKQFKLCNSDLVYGAYQSPTWDMFKKFENITLTNKDAEKIKKGVESKINTLMVMGQSLHYCRSFVSGINFKNHKFPEKLNDFLGLETGKQILHLKTNESTALVSMMVYHAIIKLEKYERKDDSFIFLSLDHFAYEDSRKSILDSFESEGRHNLLVIDNVTEDLNEMISKLLEIISEKSEKKLLIISNSATELVTQFVDTNNYEKLELIVRLYHSNGFFQNDGVTSFLIPKDFQTNLELFKFLKDLILIDDVLLLTKM